MLHKPLVRTIVKTLSILGIPKGSKWLTTGGAFSTYNITFTTIGEKTLLSSEWTLIGSELSSPNFNSLDRAERSFPIRYLNVVFKPLCSNLDICLNYCFQLQIETKDAFLDRALEQFSRFRDRNPFRSWKTQARECTYYLNARTRSWNNLCEVMTHYSDTHRALLLWLTRIFIHQALLMSSGSITFTFILHLR